MQKHPLSDMKLSKANDKEIILKQSGKKKKNKVTKKGTPIISNFTGQETVK